MHREPLLEIELKNIDTATQEAAEMLMAAKARLESRAKHVWLHGQ